jgi:hypothetical protein
LVFDFLNTFIHSQKIGGEDCIVEIDETVLVKNKYHRDRLLEYQVWAVVRGQPHTFFDRKVDDRSRNTLIEIIRSKICTRYSYFDRYGARLFRSRNNMY